jgi:hypothetical protein
MQGKARTLLHQQNADAVWQAPFEIVPALHFNPDPFTKRRLRPGNGFSHDLEPFGDVFVTQWIFGHSLDAAARGI